MIIGMSSYKLKSYRLPYVFLYQGIQLWRWQITYELNFCPDDSKYGNRIQ